MSGGSRILLAILALFGLGLGGWFLMGGGDVGASDPGAAAVLRPGASGPGVAQPERDRAVLATPGEVAAEEPRRVEEIVEPAPEPASAGDLSGALWIEGRVVFPPDTPADESCRVVARGKAFPGRSGDAKEYSADVEPSGRFRVAFAGSTRRGRIALEGRYLYLSSQVKLKPREHEGELLIEPLLGGCVEITLHPPSQAPFSDEEIEGLSVTAWSEDLPVQRRAEHVEGGRFHFTGMPPDAGLWVRPESDHFAADQSRQVVVASAGLRETVENRTIAVKAGEVTQVELELEFGIRLAGVVLDAEGTPIEGVDVRISVEDGDSSAWESLDTDEDGAWEKGGLIAGEVELAFDRDGYSSLTVDLGRLEKGSEELELEHRLDSGISVTGIVQWPDGTPVAGATVTCSQAQPNQGWSWGSDDEQEVETEPDGTFEVSGLEDRSCVLRARARPALEREEGESDIRFERRQRKAPAWHALEEDVPAGTRVVLVLTEGSGVRGKVVDDQGDPIAKFRVVARPGEDVPWGNSTGRISKSFDDPNGTFLLEGLKEGTFQLTASAHGHVDASSVEIGSPYKGGPITLELPRAAAVAGIVRDLEGRPVSGARVELQEVQEQRSDRFWIGGDKSDSTDAEGRFAFKKVRPGTLKLSATADGFGGSPVLEVEVAPAGELDDLVLDLSRPGRITGEIHAAVGDVADLEVSLHGRSEGASDWQQTDTDAQGHFAFEGLTAGEYQVQFEPRIEDIDSEDPAYWQIRQARSDEAEVTLTEGGEAHVVLGHPPDSPIVVTGRVTCGGEPVAEALVQAQQVSRSSEAAAKTDSNGRYTFTIDGAGDYVFTIGSGWGETLHFRETVPEGESFVADFDLPVASIEVLVHTPAGEPADGVRVQLDRTTDAAGEASERTIREGETSGEGRYVFDHLEPGTYVVRAGGASYWGWGDESTEYAREVRPGVVLKDGEKKTLDFRLVRGGAIRGRVLGELANVRIRLETTAGVALDNWRTYVPDADGHFRIRGLKPGAVVLIAERGEDSRRLEVDVYEGQDTELELSF